MSNVGGDPMFQSSDDHPLRRMSRNIDTLDQELTG
jgi:hypothetical protein